MEIITGYRNEAHVTAEQEGACNFGTIGGGRFVLPIGNKFAYEVLTANSIRIKDGYAINQGRMFGTPYGDYDDVTINNGVQGKKRRDVICIKYSMNEASGIEAGELYVVEGTPGDDYVTPTITSGDITTGATVDYMPLYHVNLNGLAVDSVTAVFTLKKSMEDLKSDISSLNSSLGNLKGKIFGGTFSENDDLNTYTNSGIYRCGSNVVCNTLSNRPSGVTSVYFNLMVFSYIENGNMVSQLLQDKNGIVYSRQQTTSSTWSDWQRLATGDDLEKKGLQYSYQDGIVNCTATDVVGVIEEALNKIDCKSGTSNILVKNGDNNYFWVNTCLDYAGYGFASLTNHAGTGVEYICGVYPDNNVIKVSGNTKRLATSEEVGDYYYAPVIISQNVAGGNTVSFTSQPQNLFLVTISHTWFGVISYYVSTNQQNGADIQNINKAGNGHTMSTVTASYENNLCTINVKNDSSNTMYVKVRNIT